MKKLGRSGAYGLAAGLVAVFAGCSTVTVDLEHVEPARAVKDVEKINVLAVAVKANVTGDMAGDNGRNGALVKQMISDGLYKSGFYRVTDELWGGDEGAEKIGKLLEKQRESGHGYVSFSSGGKVSASEICPKCGTMCPDHTDKPQGMKVKARLDVELVLNLDSHPVQTEQIITLATTPYVPVAVKKDIPPSSAPNVAAISKRTEKIPVTVYQSSAKGVLKVKLSGVGDDSSPVKYEKSYPISLPDSAKTGVVPETQLKLLATAVSPAIEQVLMDIAPHKDPSKKVSVPVATDGDPRLVTLLASTAYDETIVFVTELVRGNKALPADLENLGIAQEAKGNYAQAKKAYRAVLASNPDSKGAKAGVERVDAALSSAKAVAESSAKNADIKFKK